MGGLGVPGDGPVLYYVYDRATGQARYLFAHQPELERYPLAPMEPFDFTPATASRLHGYLTFPPGLDGRACPPW